MRCFVAPSLILIRREDLLEFGQPTEKLILLNYLSNHVSQIGGLAPAQQVLQIGDIVVAMILDPLPETFEVQPWPTRIPKLEHG